MIYLSLKFLHIVGAVLFLGNIITGVFWKAHADKSRDPKIIAHALDGIPRSDRIFTIPGVIIILVSGFSAALVGGYALFRTDWIVGGIGLFTITAIVFMGRIAPIQRQMRDLARSASDQTTFDWPTYEKLSRAWAIWGSVAVLAPMLAAALMVFKPAR